MTDFAELEIALRYAVLYDYSTLGELWNLEQQLVQQLHPLRPEVLTHERIVALTSCVREQAYQRLGHTPDWKWHYKVALLFYLLKVAGLKKVSSIEEKNPLRTKKRCLLAYLSAGAVAGTL